LKSDFSKVNGALRFRNPWPSDCGRFSRSSPFPALGQDSHNYNGAGEHEPAGFRHGVNAQYFFEVTNGQRAQ
jgi:hypothetical protein